MERLVAQNEFCVDVQRHNLLEVVIVKKMEHDGSSSNEGFDIGVVILQVFWEAFFNFGKELALSPAHLRNGRGAVVSVDISSNQWRQHLEIHLRILKNERSYSIIIELFSNSYILWQDYTCLGEKTCQHFTMNKEQKFTQDEENTAGAARSMIEQRSLHPQRGGQPVVYVPDETQPVAPTSTTAWDDEVTPSSEKPVAWAGN